MLAQFEQPPQGYTEMTKYMMYFIFMNFVGVSEIIRFDFGPRQVSGFIEGAAFSNGY